MVTAEAIVKALSLLPHPEGGFYKETYRSDGVISEDCLPNSFEGNRNYCTGIYYLLKSDDFSAFHKVNQDEMWHFYAGDPIEITMITNEGVLNKVRIGSNIIKGQLPQFVVPKDVWFAAKVLQPNSFALAGCTVAPGFDFKDFTLAKRDWLLKKFPHHSTIIKSHTRQ